MIDLHMITLGLTCIPPHPRGSSSNHMGPATLSYVDQTRRLAARSLEGVMEDERSPTGPEVSRDDIPDWWPFAAQFPHWHSWRGARALEYARRPRTSPPARVRGEAV